MSRFPSASINGGSEESCTGDLRFVTTLWTVLTCICSSGYFVQGSKSTHAQRQSISSWSGLKFFTVLPRAGLVKPWQPSLHEVGIVFTSGQSACVRYFAEVQ